MSFADAIVASPHALKHTRSIARFSVIGATLSVFATSAGDDRPETIASCAHSASRTSNNICLDAKAVRHCVTYSEQQLVRLEAVGKFPKRIHIGPGRVGWVFREILDWMQSKVDARPVGPMSPKVIIETSDRFVHTRELRAMVLYTHNHVRNLEMAEKFPGRIRLSDNRVVWLERELHDWLETQRKRGEEAATLKTYYVQLCRPRYEIAVVAVEAANPSKAEEMALALAKSGKSGWRMTPYEIGIYRPHVEACALEETKTYDRDTVEQILSR